MTKSSKKILIAEDDPFLGKIMTNRLQEEGFDVDHAPDGGKALEFIYKNNYALVLLDLVMPVKDGFAVLKTLKDEKNQTPVMVFSNLSQPEDKKEVMGLGAKGYYIKSDIAVDEVVQIVRDFVK